MAARPLVMFPDPRLRRRADPVELFDDDLKALAQDLMDTVVAAPAIGLSACHIGVFQRLVAIRLADDALMRLYVNPRILWTSPETKVEREGSVSMPGISEEVERPARIGLAWSTLTGAEEQAEADGFLAVVLQHEIDQLDGIFWLDRLSRLKRERAIKRYEKLRRDAR
ncbi:peptide deformylase [Phreatobacter oligotrophus]|uniref:Peptide deformylase-like n=1 Tax=Phreatobacter oligotrophus TaxID=1122261 RepID=A0A2T4ZHV6_9HYPH|nr:peptide deformylase [Phreatobacter oligotrophus]MBX9989631.1 peptide deformylase [Phreatobacter oligotrophus]PTM61571.1 peptide deformylase [Phreatobacter oligotrophus]